MKAKIRYLNGFILYCLISHLVLILLAHFTFAMSPELAKASAKPRAANMVFVCFAGEGAGRPFGQPACFIKRKNALILNR